MNWTQIEGQWDQLKGSFKHEWAKLTDDDLGMIKGRRDMLVGKLEEHYGEAREVIEKKIDALIERL